MTTVRALKLLCAVIAAIGLLSGATTHAQPQNANPSPGAFAASTQDVSGAWSIGATQDRPNWFWDFRPGTMPPGSTFTRGTSRTCIASSGGIVTVGNDVPCIEHDPVTLQPRGYLAEMQATNLVLRSQEFTAGAWVKQNGAITGDTVVAPDGTLTADTYTDNATTSPHEVYQQITLASDTYVGVSVFAKAGTLNQLFLNIQTTAGNYVTVNCDLATGTVGATAVGVTSGTLASTFIRAMGSGWWRCGFVGKVGAANPYVVIGLNKAGYSTNGSGERTYAGDGTGTLHLWGAQAEGAGVGVTSYIPTAGATATRSQDVLTIPLSVVPGWSATHGGVLLATYQLHTRTPSAPGYNQVALYAYKTDFNNSVSLKAGDGGGGQARSIVFSGGVVQAQPNAGSTPAVFTRARGVIGWGTTRIATALGGAAAIGNSGSFALPVGIDTLDIARYGAHSLNGVLESAAYYRAARPDAFVQQVSR